jgi:hypothetical protein
MIAGGLPGIAGATRLIQAPAIDLKSLTIDDRGAPKLSATDDRPMGRPAQLGTETGTEPFEKANSGLDLATAVLALERGLARILARRPGRGREETTFPILPCKSAA